MDRLRKKYLAYTLLTIFLMLAVLLTVINVISFTMAGEDADRVTAMLAEDFGVIGRSFSRGRQRGPNGQPGQSAAFPGMAEADSLRYFTFAFDANGQSEPVAFHMSAVDRDEAEAWAKKLLSESAVGWTRSTYRYRVYPAGERTYVTVIDQSRELTGPFRLLKASIIGALICLIFSFFVLLLTGKHLFAPVEGVMRQQKRLSLNINDQLRPPLNAIQTDTDLIEKDIGATEQTRSIRRHVKQMTSYLDEMNPAPPVTDKMEEKELTDLRAVAESCAAQASDAFSEKGIAFNMDMPEQISADIREGAIREVLTELLDNMTRFSVSTANLSAVKKNDRLIITASNDTTLPDGQWDQVFDRMTRLDNATGQPGHGLGLTRVKDIIKKHNGRVSAYVSDHVFTLTIHL